MVTHSLTMLEKHLVFTGETPPRNFTTNKVKKRSIKSEDPMSHRIIEKRRRDRMNNCLADLSRLIPPEYLKKGRGRIEKTEIIEMAIKHMRHLQSIIATTRFNENSNSSVPSPPGLSFNCKEPVSTPVDQPIMIKHYRMGYLECMSEAMHFLVEVQGYFSGDSLCVQMINHLHKHCDTLLKGNAFNFSKKHSVETLSNDASTSPINVNYPGSSPLGMSHSTGSGSDDNQLGRPFDVKPLEEMRAIDCSPERYSDLSCDLKKPSEIFYPRYADSDLVESENRSDSEAHQNYIVKCQMNELRKEDCKNSCESVECFRKNNHEFNSLEESESYENLVVKDENVPSQLREMLTSPSSLITMNVHSNRSISEGKGSTSPMSNASAELLINNNYKSSIYSPTKSMKTSESSDGQSGCHESDNHHMMYKFKNNIKQRFSKEKRESGECDVEENQVPIKKQKSENYHKYSDPLMRERLNLLDRTDVEEEKVFKFNTDSETMRSIRYGPESENQDSNISNRLSFGHKTVDKGRRWEEPGFQSHNNPKMWALSPSTHALECTLGNKDLGRQVPDFSPVISNSFTNLSVTTSECGPGIPIFALHAKGSFYIPLTLDHATLAPFLALLGITKTDENIDEKKVLHPVTISVNFQSHLVR